MLPEIGVIFDAGTGMFRVRDLIQTDLLSQNDIAQMAADPQIQAELRAIEQEFAGTEADGLGL